MPPNRQLEEIASIASSHVEGIGWTLQWGSFLQTGQREEASQGLGMTELWGLQATSTTTSTIVIQTQAHQKRVSGKNEQVEDQEVLKEEEIQATLFAITGTSQENH